MDFELNMGLDAPDDNKPEEGTENIEDANEGNEESGESSDQVEEEKFEANEETQAWFRGDSGKDDDVV